MVCAVIGVILAAVLGWVAIHVAESGIETARRASPYGQADGVVDAAFGLDSASIGLRDDPVAGDRERRNCIG